MKMFKWNIDRLRNLRVSVRIKRSCIETLSVGYCRTSSKQTVFLRAIVGALLPRPKLSVRAIVVEPCADVIAYSRFSDDLFSHRKMQQNN